MLKAVGKHRIDPDAVEAIIEREKGAVVLTKGGGSVVCEGQTVEDVEKILGVKPAKK